MVDAGSLRLLQQHFDAVMASIQRRIDLVRPTNPPPRTFLHSASELYSCALWLTFV